MKKSTRVLSVILAAVMLVTAFAFTSCADKNYAANNTTIKIGVSGPLTGDYASYGMAVSNCAKLAIEEINAAGGLNGIMFELIDTNDEADSAKVSATYSDMYQKGMQISLGTVTTGAGIEFKALAEEDNVFYLTPSATGDAIPNGTNGFQMCFTDSNQGTASAEYFNRNFVGKKIGILYQADNDYSVGITNNFKKSIDESFKAGMVETSFTGKPTSYDSQVESLKDCDVVFLPIYTSEAAVFMRAATSKMKGDAIFFGCDGLDGIDTAVEGFDINTIKQEVSYLSHFNSKATEGPAAELIAKYNEKFDESKFPINQFGASAYDCVYAIYEALKVAVADGKTITATMSPSEFCDILSEVFKKDDFSVRGVTGECIGNEKSTISWNDDGTVSKNAIKYVVKEATA